MNIKIIVILSFSALYMLFEFYIARKKSRNSEITESGDKGTFRLITIAIAAGYWLSYILAMVKVTRMHPWNTFFVLGFLIVAAGLVIRITSITTLNKYFTSTVTGIKDHKLIDKGIYKKIRHPAYLGQLIIFLGISLTLSNWLSVLGMMIPVLAAYLHRISVEEKFLTGLMPDEYRGYRKRTKKLVPYLY